MNVDPPSHSEKPIDRQPGAAAPVEEEEGSDEQDDDDKKKSPVVNQPTPGGSQPPSAGWGQGPPPQGGFSACPQGLEYLLHIDQLLIKQQVEILEAFTGFETNNRYEILNSVGQKVYIAVEDTCCLFRMCMGKVRPFDIKVMDLQGTELIHLERPLRCDKCPWFCCLQKLEVQAPPGAPIGSVHQTCHVLDMPRYDIKNENNETVLKIKGPCCRCSICGDVEFEVTSKDGETQVGIISKQWSGLAKEIFTDADNFGVSFPIDMDAKTKATLMGAVFLIDFMYYEEEKKSD
ncbi:hypothetical protein ACOMHN_040352 [Nucella lapillus]